MNQVAGTSYFWKSLSRRGVPTSPENSPRWMSDGESSPPYEPSQPPTASMSTPNTHLMSLGILGPRAFVTGVRGGRPSGRSVEPRRAGVHVARAEDQQARDENRQASPEHRGR